MSLVVFIVIAVLGYLHYRSSVEFENKLINEKLQAVYNYKKSFIENFIEQNIEKVQLISSRTQLRISLDAYNQTKEEKHFKKINKIIKSNRKTTSL